MKSGKGFYVALFTVAVFLVGCASSSVRFTHDEIKDYPLDVQEKIIKGEVAPGMTQQQAERTLRGEGFTGNAPGGPSRWSTERTETYEPLRHELVIEVTYDHVSGGRFRHGTAIHRWRPDKAPARCKREQIAPPARVSGPAAEILGRS